MVGGGGMGGGGGAPSTHFPRHKQTFTNMRNFSSLLKLLLYNIHYRRSQILALKINIYYLFIFRLSKSLLIHF